MRTSFMTIAALVGASALTINAQTPQSKPQPTQQPPQQQQPRPTDPTRTTGDMTQRAGQANTPQMVTVTGCLKSEKDVPGRQPNAAERSGMGENYVLSGVKMATSSTTSGIGLAPMYQIEGIAAAELQKHLNHQVEITGTLTTGNAMGDRGASATGTTGSTGKPEGSTGKPMGSAGKPMDSTGKPMGSTGNQAGAHADLPELQATSLKMVAATCAAQ